VNKRQNVLTILLLALVTIELFSLLNSSQADELLSIKLSFEQPYYSSNQKFSAIITVQNGSDKKVTNATVKFYLGERLDLEKDRALPTEPPKKPVYSFSWHKTVKPGETQLKTSKAITSAKLTEGAYPAWAVIVQKNKIVAKKLSALVIVDSKTVPPLGLAILWNLNDKVHYDSDGIFVDDQVQTDCHFNSHKAGIYSIYLSALTTHPNFKANINFTPLLVQQIQNISQGYRIKKGGKTVRISRGSKESTNAEQLLSGYERLIKNGQVEIVPAPFSYPSLDYLADQGWEDDAIAQIKKGRTVTKKAFNLLAEPAGTYIPGLDLSPEAFSFLSESETEYTVLSEAWFSRLVKNKRDIYKPYRLQDRNNSRITVFFADSLAADILCDTSDPEASMQLLLGVLAETYLKQPEKQKVAVIAPNDQAFRPNAELLETLYTRVEQAPWLKPTTFTIASQLISPDTKPIELPGKSFQRSAVDSGYSQRLAKTKKKIKQFSEMTEKVHPLEKKLLDDLLVAEAGDFLKQKESGGENLGLGFLQSIEEEIRAELNKITMPESQTVTLTSNKGKIPIPIHNKTLYPLKITITAKSDGLEFPAGNSKRIILHPRENLFTLPVLTKDSKPKQIEVTLHYQDYTIEKSRLTLKSTYFNITIFIILGLLVVAICLPLAWRYFRSK